MNLIYNKIFLQHDTGDHPESSRRFDYLKNLKETKVENGEKYLDLIYSKKYIESIKEASKQSMSLDPDTVTCQKSYEVACYAVGATIQAAEKGDFALVRPPGHHASSNQAMGFCIFNNIAIATKHLVNKGKKVFILDFDCHYGNGTAEIFYKTNKVLYLSTHQFPYYPGNGYIDEIGEGEGKGFNIHMPLPARTGDDIYLEALNLFIPIVKKQFKPHIVAVSAGFDAHKSDPVGGLNFSLHAYHETGKLLRKNFRNIFAVLEGGYNPSSLAKCIMAFNNGVNGKEAKLDEDTTKTDDDSKKEFNDNLEKLITNLKPYWKF